MFARSLSPFGGTTGRAIRMTKGILSDDKRTYIVELKRSSATMGVIVEIPDELADAVESKASELKVDASRFIAALVREKLKLPVQVGVLDVFVPADVTEYQLEREPGESDDDYEAAKVTFDALFKAALK
jgi:hypothetical protein